jgi:phosphatidylinositol alpha-1,6-mannosyltransferase
MKKILIATIDFPPICGGVANYLAGIAENLPQDKVVVLAPLAESNEAAGYKIYRKKLISNSFFLWPKWLPLIYHLFRIARKEKIEAILVGQVLPVGTAALIIKKIFNIPYFVSCHGMDILTAQKNLRKKKILNKILKETQGIISNSEFTKNELIKLGVEENKITIIYPYVPDIKPVSEELLKSIPKKYDLENKKIVLTVGRLVERKGHDKVIEAFPAVLEKIPNARYVIVGDGQERGNLEIKARELGLSGQIIFTGAVDDAERDVFYQLSDVFITVSRQIRGDVEGFGTVYLEANQYGKPVIAGNSGGAGEAVINGLNGLLINPSNREEIAAAIIKLLSDNDFALKLGKEGQERVEREFKWGIVSEKLRNLFLDNFIFS